MKKSAVSLAMAAIMLTGAFGTPVMASEVDYALKDAKFDNVELKLYMNQNTTTLEYAQEKINEFNEMDNGITVEITNINTESN